MEENKRRPGRVSVQRQLVSSLVCLALVWLAAPLEAQDTPHRCIPDPGFTQSFRGRTGLSSIVTTAPAGQSAETEEEPSEQPTSSPATAGETKPPNPCDLDLRLNRALLDKARGATFEVVCRSARWFDHFFGNESYWRSASRLHGRLGLIFIGDEHEGLDVDTTFRAEVDLPNLENKVNVFLRRDDEQDYISSYDPEIELIPEFRRLESQRRWMLGAGYHPMGGASKGLDLDLGVELGSPLEPLARARYRHYWMIGQRSMLRTRQSAYWTNIRGFGTAAAVNVDRPFGDGLLLRFSGGGDINEVTDGVAWKSSLSLFQMVNHDRALVYRIGVGGETDARYPVEEWVTEVRLRQRMFREWFVGEVIVGSSWIHETVGAPREAGLYLGVGFELSFDRGDAYSPSPSAAGSARP